MEPLDTVSGVSSGPVTHMTPAAIMRIVPPGINNSDNAIPHSDLLSRVNWPLNGARVTRVGTRAANEPSAKFSHSQRKPLLGPSI